VVANQQDRAAEEDQPHHEPLRLLAGQFGIDSVDHDEADRRQQRGKGEDVGIGVGQSRTDEQVSEHAQPEKHGAVGERGVADVLGARGQHCGEAGRHENRDRQQSEELPGAG
jgi:hypothetical protein